MGHPALLLLFTVSASGAAVLKAPEALQANLIQLHPAQIFLALRNGRRKPGTLAPAA